MKKILICSSVVVLIAIIVGSFVYVYSLGLDPGFWKNAVGNLLATLIGLAAGVPIGLWINRLVTDEQIENRKATERKRELELLGFIKKEIKFCKDNVFPYRPRPTNNYLYLRVPYKTATWDALCASTEIKYILPLGLLNQIAYAYHHIKAQNWMERQILITFNAGRTPQSAQLRSDAQVLDPQFIAQVNRALYELDLRIEALKN